MATFFFFRLTLILGGAREDVGPRADDEAIRSIQSRDEALLPLCRANLPACCGESQSA